MMRIIPRRFGRIGEGEASAVPMKEMLTDPVTAVCCCPECGNANVGRAPRQYREKQYFVVKEPLVCQSCRVVFLPAASMWLRVLAVIVGLGGIAFAVSWALIPGIAMLIEGVRLGKAAFEIVAGTTTSTLFAYILYDGYRSGRPRIVDEDVELF